MNRIFHLIVLWAGLGTVFGYSDTLHYDLTIFGITCGEISYISEKDKMAVTAQSSGFVEYFYPFKNDYNTSFDTLSFGVRHYKKITRQGEFKQRLSGNWDKSLEEFTYDKLESFKRADSCMTIFTFLERLNRKSSEDLDTQWFPLEHEGNMFKSRVLLADTSELIINGHSFMCNHFRLDLLPDDKEIKMLDRSDYFSHNITRPDAVKQIWVERKPSGKILKASVKIGPITVTATLKNERVL